MQGLKGGPLSSATVQSASGDCNPRGKATTVGSSFVVSTAAITNSGIHLGKGRLEGLCHRFGCGPKCALGIPILKSASDHDQSFHSSVLKHSTRFITGNFGAHRSTSKALSVSYTTAISGFESPLTSTITGVERMMSTSPRLTSHVILQCRLNDC